MGKLVTTLIVEPRSLVCQALVSLMQSHSYHVIGGIASTADIDSDLLVADAPKLVILVGSKGRNPRRGARRVALGVSQASLARLSGHGRDVQHGSQPGTNERD